MFSNIQNVSERIQLPKISNFQAWFLITKSKFLIDYRVDYRIDYRIRIDYKIEYEKLRLSSFNYFWFQLFHQIKHKGSVLESLWGADSISVHGSGGGFWLGRNQNRTESIPSLNKYNRNINFKKLFNSL